MSISSRTHRSSTVVLVVLSRNIGLLPRCSRKPAPVKSQRFINRCDRRLVQFEKYRFSGSQFYRTAGRRSCWSWRSTRSRCNRHQTLWVSFDSAMCMMNRRSGRNVHNIILRTLVENGAQLSKKKNNDFSMDNEISNA